MSETSNAATQGLGPAPQDSASENAATETPGGRPPVGGVRISTRRKWVLQGVLLLVAGLGGFGLLQHRAEHRGLPQPLVPATDWLVWHQLPGELVCSAVLTPLFGGSERAPLGVAPGDTLAAVDYRPVKRLEHLHALTRNPQPGSLLVYKLRPQRTGPSAPQPADKLLFVELSYRPPGLFTESKTLWYSQAWWLLVVLGFSLVVFAAVLPLRSTNYQLSIRLGLRLALATMVFSLPLLRHWLAHAPPAAPVQQLDGLLLLLYLVLVSAYALSLWPGGWGWAVAPALLAAAVGPAFVIDALYLQPILGAQATGIVYYQHAVVLLLLAGAYLLPVNAAGQSSRYSGRLLLGGVLLVAWGLLLAALFRYLQTGAEPAGTLVLAQVALAAPVAATALYVFRYGNLAWMVLRLLVWVLLVLVLLGVYKLMVWALHPLVAEPLVLQGLALAAGALAALALRLVYLRLRGRWSQWVLTPAQRRMRALQSFLDSMPQYGERADMVQALQDALVRYTQTAWVRIRLPQDLETGDADWRQVAALLGPDDRVWGRRKELLPLVLPGRAEQTLLNNGVELAAAFAPKGQASGLILLGRKQKGVFTLEEVNQLRRVGRQLRLSLDLLNLVERQRALARQAAEANLTALRSQINPHFLFNTLNTISSLIHDAPDQAEEAIILLGDIFRYTLRHSGSDFVTFAEEISLVSNYLQIEQIRFGDQLVVEIELDPAAAEQHLPAFVIQTLVENAIKHGVGKVTHQGWTAVNVNLTAGYVVATVEDNGPGVRQQRIRQGTGLNNVIERLSTIYGRTDLIEFVNTNPGTCVTLRIPLGPPPTLMYDGESERPDS